VRPVLSCLHEGNARVQRQSPIFERPALERESLAPMSASNHRHERIGEEIAHEINAMLAGELKDPRLEVSVVVSEVRLAPDMRHARIFVAVRGTEPEQEDAIKALEHAAGFIRHELVERLQLRRTPDLHFTLDRSQEYSERIERLLNDVKKDTPSRS
jgi:ribosome-binding factor A